MFYNLEGVAATPKAWVGVATSSGDGARNRPSRSGAKEGSIHQEAYPGYMILLIGLTKLHGIRRENV